MKVLLIFVVCSFLGLSEQGPILTLNERMRLKEECIAETNIPKPYITEIVRTLKVPLDNQKYAEYLTCNYKKQGFQTEEGVIHYDKVRVFLENFYNVDEAKNAVGSCRNVNGSTNVVIFSNCIIKKLKEIRVEKSEESVEGRSEDSDEDDDGLTLKDKERKRMSDECIAETKVSKSYIHEFLRELKIPLGNQKYAEFLTCYYKKQGFQTEEGVIHYDNMKEFLGNVFSVDEAKNAVDSCRNLNGSTDGEKAVIFANCIIEKLKEIMEERPEEPEEGRSEDSDNDVNNEDAGNSDVFVKKITDDTDNTVNTNKISVVNTGDNNETTANNNEGVAEIA